MNHVVDSGAKKTRPYRNFTNSLENRINPENTGTLLRFRWMSSSGDSSKYLYCMLDRLVTCLGGRGEGLLCKREFALQCRYVCLDIYLSESCDANKSRLKQQQQQKNTSRCVVSVLA